LLHRAHPFSSGLSWKALTHFYCNPQARPKPVTGVTLPSDPEDDEGHAARAGGRMPPNPDQ